MRVAILGDGQLARMMGLEAQRLGVACVSLGDAEHPPAAASTEHRRTPLTDAGRVCRFLDDVDVVTVETENVPASTLEAVERRFRLRPGMKVVSASQDRLTEKRLFRQLDIRTASFVAVDGASDLRRAAEELGYPFLLKTRRNGYDGRGQAWIEGPARLEARLVEGELAGLLAEGRVPFDRELSVLGVRNERGELAFYPVVENAHRGGILRASRAPAPRLQERDAAVARDLLTRVLEEVDYVGVAALELFEVGGALVANELAPRVHNSGHWTIEGAQTSQFENHLRAVLGLPLGSTGARGHSVMLNVIGEVPPLAGLLRHPEARLHLYGKEGRPGRKVGHVTITARSGDEAERAARGLAWSLGDTRPRPSHPGASPTTGARERSSTVPPGGRPGTSPRARRTPNLTGDAR